MLFVLMGVSGSGKSTVGSAVAQRLRLRFFEGDDFHPIENIERMKEGVPLTDADRVPWIAALARAINESGAKDAIVACSALTQSVRQQLATQIVQPILFIHLTGDREVIHQRLARRPQHFMKSSMLDSQLAALEVSQDALIVDINAPLADVIRDTEALITSRMARPNS